MTTVVIADTGTANTASLVSAFGALGMSASVTDEPVAFASASFAVLPGVGSFAAGMRRLQATGMDRAVRQRVEKGRPLLAICLGMQMLCDGSDESPGVPGLEIIPATARRLPAGFRPHLGWNSIRSDGNGIPSGMAAFANSFALNSGPAEWDCAWTRSGVRFVSAIRRDRILACQFHPELSGDYGIGLIKTWVTGRKAPPGPATTAEDLYRPTRRLIPCLDVAEGRVMKGVKFGDLRDVGEPASFAQRYEAQGADEIVVLDIGATPRNTRTRLDTFEAIRGCVHIPLTVGGGVRSIHGARSLLEAGADRVSVNTAAVRNSALIAELSDRFGNQCIVAAVDVRSKGPGWEVLVSGGREATGRDAIDWMHECASLGAGEILLTSFDRDGTRDGSDLELLRRSSRAIPIPIIASGGIGSRQDVADAFRAGADAVLAASVFHDHEFSVRDVKNYLANEGITVRQ